jgi:phospholipase D1/2
MIYTFDREPFPPTRLDLQAHPRLHFRLDGKHPFGGSQHQKIIVVDDKVAFAGGIDLAKRRWDTSHHLLNDPRRVGPDGKPYPPHHDVQMAVDGPAAAALGELARERWRRATGEKISRPPVLPGDPWPPVLEPDLTDIDVAIARTEPAYRGNQEVREVEALYLDAIAAAQKYIYIENQYFTSVAVGKALAARLREEDGPEILLVLPLKRYGWLEEYTLGLLRSRLVRKLQREDRFHRLRLYYPFVEGLKRGCENVHAKVFIADDAFVRVGSANLNNRSMGLDSECDLAVEVAKERNVEQAIMLFRNRLLADHLGMTAEEVSETIEAEGSLIKGVEVLRKRVSDHNFEPLHLDVPEWMDEIIPPNVILDPPRPLDPEKLVAHFISEEGTKIGYQHFKGLFIAFLFLLGIAGVWQWTPLPLLSGQALFEEMASFHPLTTFSLVAVAYVIGSIFFVPVTILIFLTMILFKSLNGFFYALLGVHLAALSLYGVGRLVGRDTVRRVSGSFMRSLNRSSGFRETPRAAIANLLPLSPFTVVNLVAGASRVRLRAFLLGTLFGLTPGIIGIAFLAHRMKIAVRHPGIENAVALFAVALGMLILFLGFHRTASRRRSSKKMKLENN